MPLGRLADRRGPRGMSVLLALATAAAIASFLLVSGFVAFVAAACLYAAAQSGLSAARQALLAALVPAEQRTGLLARLDGQFRGDSEPAVLVEAASVRERTFRHHRNRPNAERLSSSAAR
ncbi:MFS transporter [Streptomyces sediminimaris]|uniref:MFS transporter n=1 Tax=Streptomyces sediminimaris TaxID=3383721 RepID=UPI0039995700